jgi:hypothetical protein
MHKRFPKLVVDVPIGFYGKRPKLRPRHLKKDVKRLALKYHKLPAYAAHPSMAVALDWGQSEKAH